MIQQPPPPSPLLSKQQQNGFFITLTTLVAFLLLLSYMVQISIAELQSPPITPQQQTYPQHSTITTTEDHENFTFYSKTSSMSLAPMPHSNIKSTLHLSPAKSF